MHIAGICNPRYKQVSCGDSSLDLLSLLDALVEALHDLYALLQSQIILLPHPEPPQPLVLDLSLCPRFALLPLLDAANDPLVLERAVAEEQPDPAQIEGERHVLVHLASPVVFVPPAAGAVPRLEASAPVPHPGRREALAVEVVLDAEAAVGRLDLDGGGRLLSQPDDRFLVRGGEIDSFSDIDPSDKLQNKFPK